MFLTLKLFSKEPKTEQSKKIKVFLFGNTFLLLFAISLMIFALITQGIGVNLCPIKNLLNVPCPFCGGTRCAISFLSLDLISAFKYHPSTLILIFYSIFIEIIFIIDIIFNKNLNKIFFKIDIIVYTYLIITAIQYAIRLYYILSGTECSFMFLNL